MFKLSMCVGTMLHSIKFAVHYMSIDVVTMPHLGYCKVTDMGFACVRYSAQLMA
jgi:hypothetical protein